MYGQYVGQITIFFQEDGMSSKKKFEFSTAEGEVIGHFAEFKDQMDRAFINSETGEEDGRRVFPPKIRPGVIVQVMGQRVNINVENGDEKLPYNTEADGVSLAAKKKVLSAVRKKHPFGAKRVIKIRTTVEDGWKKYSIAKERPDTTPPSNQPKG